MIRYNTDCPYLHDIFDQYCNLFKGYKNCDKGDCEVLKILKENERLKQENEQVKQKLDWFLTETIAGKEYRPKEELEELQREKEQLKAQNEKMKRCSNCVYRFVRHFSQEGTCQRPNCKNYSD